ncbi:hypothetical protein E2C01_035330 [Portunus trituberculatus]|uniref:Uncharacterized protein n=1 Tax=Portunus trituberculatus TaxID=210409 RepID=A0A5B7F9G8_PORTR|nr:hypothetical protein [Portunus trituberculatus]
MYKYTSVEEATGSVPNRLHPLHSAATSERRSRPAGAPQSGTIEHLIPRTVACVVAHILYGSHSAAAGTRHSE